MRPSAATAQFAAFGRSYHRIASDVAPEQHSRNNTKARLSNILPPALKSAAVLHRSTPVQASYFDTLPQTHRDPNPIEKSLKYFQIRNVPYKDSKPFMDLFLQYTAISASSMKPRRRPAFAAGWRNLRLLRLPQHPRADRWCKSRSGSSRSLEL
jgi:hypothetical protein